MREIIGRRAETQRHETSAETLGEVLRRRSCWFLAEASFSCVFDAFSTHILCSVFCKIPRHLRV